MYLNAINIISGAYIPSISFRGEKLNSKPLNDNFEKSQTDKKVIRGDFISAMQNSNFKAGAGFMASLVTGWMIAKYGFKDAEKHLTSQQSMVFDSNEGSVKSNDFFIDGDDGIFNMRFLPIWFRAGCLKA